MESRSMVPHLNRTLAFAFPFALVLALSWLAAPPATAEDCDGSTQNGAGWVDTVISCGNSGQESGHNPPATTEAGSTPFYTSYRWEPACGVAAGPVHTCMAVCPNPDEVPYRLMGLHEGVWFPLDLRCSTDQPTSPQVTPALVARAFQRIPLPSLRSVTQPADKTLINFDTIFYVDAQPLHRTLHLLGQQVDLEITPSTFRWVHGDGTTTETHTAGAAYPAKDVVHRYQQAHVTVRQHVEIVWTARWSLNGGPMQDVDGTVTTVGPETPLRVAEATPVLSGYGH